MRVQKAHVLDELARAKAATEALSLAELRELAERGNESNAHKAERPQPRGAKLPTPTSPAVFQKG
jgi:hypothetical protein